MVRHRPTCNPINSMIYLHKYYYNILITMSTLLQIKMEQSLKEKLQRVAMSKGLNLTSYIKMTLIEATENDSDTALTENGFTVREERRLLKSIQEGEKELHEGKLKTYSNIDDALQSLDE